ncbi:hypothetical protein RJ639_039247 [Escallonia herrerae]|uniref:C3H1-type domain-containing protein n=1 Tax=Escallonia herrerae TaxID=1293975 RepID=A0AA88WL26_9ASTE|nr:hypothetical protein RJ639_039247 [Escallonia herrerae]
MSFPDPPSQPIPFFPPPFYGGNSNGNSSDGGFWPQLPMNNDSSLPHSRFEHMPSFKRPRISDNNSSPNPAPFPPMNRRINPPVNKGTTHIFFKTRMCAKFLEGNCRNGDNCTFAHGSEDLREPPPNWQELVKDRGAGSWNEDQQIHRMKICKKFYNGEECPYGERCNFLHERPIKFQTETEIPRDRESSAIIVGTMGAYMGHRGDTDQAEVNKQVNSGSDAHRVNILKPAFWKTKICSKWEATGYCLFGERCHFAHGESELQVLGGCVEAELLMSNGSIPTKPLPVPLNDTSPTTVVVGAPAMVDREEGKKCFSKWKGQKKINRIYADWIDDLLPPHMLPSKVES